MTKKNSDNSEKLSNDLKDCFIITPIGNSDSDIFQKTEGLINSVLKPVLQEFGFRPLPAHRIDNAGSINKQIIQKIINCELVIANLTTINPNVMYELAIRHSFGKKVITLAENGTKLPFDIVDQRTIFYEDSMLGVDELKPRLRNAIEATLSDDEETKISNPIYDAVNLYASLEKLPGDQKNPMEILFKKIDNLEKTLFLQSQSIEFERISSNNLNKIPNSMIEDIRSYINMLVGRSGHISFDIIQNKLYEKYKIKFTHDEISKILNDH